MRSINITVFLMADGSVRPCGPYAPQADIARQFALWTLTLILTGAETTIVRIHPDVSAATDIFGCGWCGELLFLPADGSISGFSSSVSPLPPRSPIRILRRSRIITTPIPSCFSSMSTSTPSIEVGVSPGYQVPSYFYLLKNFDSIYASGLFCHIAKIGKKRDQQLRLVWAVEQMLGKLREVREENLQLRSPFFHAKRYAPPFRYISLQTIELTRFVPLTPPDLRNERSLRNSKPPKSRSPLMIAWRVKPSYTKRLGRG